MSINNNYNETNLRSNSEKHFTNNDTPENRPQQQPLQLVVARSLEQLSDAMTDATKSVNTLFDYMVTVAQQQIDEKREQGAFRLSLILEYLQELDPSVNLRAEMLESLSVREAVAFVYRITLALHFQRCFQDALTVPVDLILAILEQLANQPTHNFLASYQTLTTLSSILETREKEHTQDLLKKCYLNLREVLSLNQVLEEKVHKLFSAHSYTSQEEQMNTMIYIGKMLADVGNKLFERLLVEGKIFEDAMPADIFHCTDAELFHKFNEAMKHTIEHVHYQHITHPETETEGEKTRKSSPLALFTTFAASEKDGRDAQEIAKNFAMYCKEWEGIITLIPKIQKEFSEEIHANPDSSPKRLDLCKQILDRVAQEPKIWKGLLHFVDLSPVLLAIPQLVKKQAMSLQLLQRIFPAILQNLNTIDSSLSLSIGALKNLRVREAMTLLLKTTVALTIQDWKSHKKLQKEDLNSILDILHQLMAATDDSILEDHSALERLRQFAQASELLHAKELHSCYQGLSIVRKQALFFEKTIHELFPEQNESDKTASCAIINISTKLLEIGNDVYTQASQMKQLVEKPISSKSLVKLANFYEKTVSRKEMKSTAREQDSFADSISVCIKTVNEAIIGTHLYLKKISIDFIPLLLSQELGKEFLQKLQSFVKGYPEAVNKQLEALQNIQKAAKIKTHLYLNSEEGINHEALASVEFPLYEAFNSFETLISSLQHLLYFFDLSAALPTIEQLLKQPTLEASAFVEFDKEEPAEKVEKKPKKSSKKQTAPSKKQKAAHPLKKRDISASQSSSETEEESVDDTITLSLEPLNVHSQSILSEAVSELTRHMKGKRSLESVCGSEIPSTDLHIFDSIYHLDHIEWIWDFMKSAYKKDDEATLQFLFPILVNHLYLAQEQAITPLYVAAYPGSELFHSLKKASTALSLEGNYSCEQGSLTYRYPHQQKRHHEQNHFTLSPYLTPLFPGEKKHLATHSAQSEGTFLMEQAANIMQKAVTFIAANNMNPITLTSNLNFHEDLNDLDNIHSPSTNPLDMDSLLVQQTSISKLMDKLSSLCSKESNSQSYGDAAVYLKDALIHLQRLQTGMTVYMANSSQQYDSLHIRQLFIASQYCMELLFHAQAVLKGKNIVSNHKLIDYPKYLDLPSFPLDSLLQTFDLRKGADYPFHECQKYDSFGKLRKGMQMLALSYQTSNVAFEDGEGFAQDKKEEEFLKNKDRNYLDLMKKSTSLISYILNELDWNGLE